VTGAQATAAPPMAPAAPPAPAPPRAVAGGPQSVSLSGYGEPARPEPGKGKGSQAEKKRTTTPSSGLTKREFPEDPQAFIKQNLDRYVCMSQVQIEAIEQLPLPEKEQRLVEPASKGNLRLREILSMSSLLRTKTIQFLVALYANGFVDLSDSPSATANEADLLGEIKEHLSRIERSNHFAALEIHMSSTGKEVEAAYKGLMEKYSEAKLAGHSAEVREAASKLRGGLQKAYKAICAHADRQAYRRDQVGDWKVGWYAEFQFNKGDSMLTLREDIEQALGYFESAYDLAPENGLYLAAVAYTRFRAAGAGSDKAARQEARSLMDKARKLSPKEPQVLIIAARLEFDCRMVVEARNLLRAAEKLCPDPQKYSQLVRAYRVGDLE